MNLNEHPCFNGEAKHLYGRVHLPVAPKCNIQCNYCSREYDCINESRPGVTSMVLSPEQSVKYMKKLTLKKNNIRVVGIAGPGDPFANPDETMKTLSMIRENHPDLLLCVATNGLNIGEYIDELAKIKTTHATVTVNAVDAKVGSKIYSWIRYRKKIYRGFDAAALLIEKQLDAVKKLKEAGIAVKINSIFIPGINDIHSIEVAEKVRSLGADYMNLMPLYPNKGTVFENIKEPDEKEIGRFREMLEKIIPQMKHCARCRADACGLIDDEMSLKDFDFMKKTGSAKNRNKKKYYAVTSREGIFINSHLGEAGHFDIFENTDGKINFLCRRKAAPAGTQDKRWIRNAEILNDCAMIFTAGAGDNPVKIFKEKNITAVICSGMISSVLENYFINKTLPLSSGRKGCGSGISCSGTGAGCG